jgi:hypothetical protein
VTDIVVILLVAAQPTASDRKAGDRKDENRENYRALEKFINNAITASTKATLSNPQLGVLLVAIVIWRTEEKGLPVSWNKSMFCDMVDVLAWSCIPGEFYIWVPVHFEKDSIEPVNRNPIMLSIISTMTNHDKSRQTTTQMLH